MGEHIFLKTFSLASLDQEFRSGDILKNEVALGETT
jgi:hypothetical protein